MIAIRPATLADADLLLAWANDPVTRAAGFHRGEIAPETHARWLRERLASPGDRLYIGIEAGRPVGQVRLERGAAGRVEVGIAVAPAERGRGVGDGLLRAVIAIGVADQELGARVFVARIRPQNRASIALFAGAGFRPAGSGDVDGQRALVYELPVV